MWASSSFAAHDQKLTTGVRVVRSSFDVSLSAEVKEHATGSSHRTWCGNGEIHFAVPVEIADGHSRSELALGFWTLRLQDQIGIRANGASSEEGVYSPNSRAVIDCRPRGADEEIRHAVPVEISGG